MPWNSIWWVTGFSNNQLIGTAGTGQPYMHLFLHIHPLHTFHCQANVELILATICLDLDTLPFYSLSLALLFGNKWFLFFFFGGRRGGVGWIFNF